MAVLLTPGAMMTVKPLTVGVRLRQLTVDRLVALAMFSAVAVGCAATPPGYETSVSSEAGAPLEGQIATNDSVANADFGEAERVADQAGEQVGQERRSLPQLIKRAELDLTVESVDDTIAATTVLVQQQGGDLLGLENYTPADTTSQHIASMELRVPQVRLEDTLSKLTELGEVNRQSLTAEDVSSQLVDFEARLKNLRKAEEVTLSIMERSGDISDVLQVGQELQNIRASIEQIAGQVNHLRNQVSYSTIQLRLENTIPATPETSTVMAKLGNTWTAATRSFSELTLALVQLGIWLLVYIPYWLVLGGLVFLAYRFTRRPKSSDS
ncbi:MAG: DUF4349 domain-containing protein [Cyanothece sp. SIO2G6]|nr:DUF4349 domain-containing protein [Cyanothece sp. SIO2G6]